MLKALLQHPRTCGLEIDDPQTTMLLRLRNLFDKEKDYCSAQGVVFSALLLYTPTPLA